MTLPTLLDQTAATYPLRAAAAFHRFAYRSGCPRQPQNDSLVVTAGASSDSLAVKDAAPWHAMYDAREKHTESARSVCPCPVHPLLHAHVLMYIHLFDAE